MADVIRQSGGKVAGISNILRQPFYEKCNLLDDLYWKTKTATLYRAVFGGIGSKCIIRRPMFISNPQYIFLGSRVQIRDGVRLEAVVHTRHRTPHLLIGNNVNIEQNVHIVCQGRIVIGNDVSITGNCAIIDATHPYEDIANEQKIGARILDEDSYVEIGDGTFLGFASLIMPNVRIGKRCVIGAHSVVTSDIPDYSVALGTPARVIRRYDPTAEAWLSVN